MWETERKMQKEGTTGRGKIKREKKWKKRKCDNGEIERE